MNAFNSMNITSSALSAQRLRMDVVSSNMANAESTRAQFVNGEWQPYRRKMVVLQPQNQFSTFLKQAMNTNQSGDGVAVSKIVEDRSPFKLVFDPSHPDANEDGYVEMPNVDPLREMVDLISSTRSYEANVTVLNATKGIMMKTLEIGK
ncbi:flagellar basal body rod protein FlgC [Bacillus carboniphilus]|uniref:Flagellar basal-body rod protein FlgC n=1 Tax=Bacillus carboniphilus TaxID=86663 RepID=A0ABP3G0E0_9BACI